MSVCARFALALLILLATPPLFAQAYVAGPSDARTGVVLVHDWFGVSPFYTQAAEKLASDGYRVIAVDLYAGSHATTHDEANKLLQSVHDDVAGREIDSAIAQLSKSKIPQSYGGLRALPC